MAAWTELKLWQKFLVAVCVAPLALELLGFFVVVLLNPISLAFLPADLVLFLLIRGVYRAFKPESSIA